MASEGDLNKINGDVFYAGDVTVLLTSLGTLSAQQSYEQVISDSSSWTNTDNLGADIFTDVNGAKNTVDTTNTTAIYDKSILSYILPFTDEASGDSTHDPDSVTNPENFFDDDDGTYAEKNDTANLGKTFSSKYVGGVKIKATSSTTKGADAANTSIVLQTYNGATWDAVVTLDSDSSASVGVTSTYDGYYLLNDTVQGVRIVCAASSGAGATKSTKFYTLEYGDFDTSGIVETNTIIDEIIPKNVVVYGKVDLPTDTSITIDLSDDGGSTFGITGKELNTQIDTSSFSGSDLAIKFNLATTDVEATPKIYGYGISITNI